jgi:hypothetical protein
MVYVSAGNRQSNYRPRTREHFKDNLGAINVTFTEQDHARLNTVAGPEQAIVPYYTGELIDFKPSQYRW